MSSLAIATYEVRRLLREPGLWAMLFLFLCMSGYAAVVGADWVQKRNATIELITEESQKRLADMREFVVQSYPSIILPVPQPVLHPPAMAPVSISQADAYPFTAEIIPLGDYTHLFKRVWSDIDNPTLRAAGRFDLAFVIVFLLPLVILAITYDLWTREREQGVATMVLSQPVTIGSLIAMKALARGLVVLLPATAIVLAVAACAGAQDLIGLVSLGAVVLAYGGFWLVMAVVINLLARHSTEAAIAAGAIWLLIVVMAPSLTLASVNLIVPAPSEMQFASELKARKTEVAESLRVHREANPAQSRTPAPTVPDKLRDIYADNVVLDSEIEKLIVAHHGVKDARRDLLDKLRFFLPSVAVQDALDRIAGSDPDRALAFEHQVRKAQLEFRQVYKGYLDRDALLTVDEYDNPLRFNFREAGDALRTEVLADLIALLAITLLILIAVRALLRRAATP